MTAFLKTFTSTNPSHSDYLAMTLSSRSSSKKALDAFSSRRISAAPTVSCASIPETFTSSAYSTKILRISTSLPPPPHFGLRSAAMMCQRTTSAVSHMFGNLGYQCTNYIDDFGRAESPSRATMAFETLEELFSFLSLVSSPEKKLCPLHLHGLSGSPFKYH